MDLIADLAEVLAAARSFSSQQEAALEQDEYQGSDPTDSVVVTVDRAGLLLRCVVDDQWADRVGSAGLATAVRGAAAAALCVKMGLPTPSTEVADQNWEEIVASYGPVESYSPPEPTQQDVEKAERLVLEKMDDLTSAVDRLSIEEAREQFKRQLDRLADLGDSALSLASMEPIRYASHSDNVVLSLAPNGLLIDCEIREHWASGQSGKSISMTIQEIIDKIQQDRKDRHHG